MRFNGAGIGLGMSALLAFPIGLLDLYVAFNNYIGNWAASFFVLPYLTYFGMAALLRWKGYARLGEGLVIGGVVFSTLIIVGAFFLALMFSAATEFG